MPDRSHQVVVVGAGPAGLFACHELLLHGIHDVLLVDRGKLVQEREPGQEILFGVGGAGLFSDGKLNFAARRGKTDLTEFLPPLSAQKLIDDLEATFSHFGMDGESYPSDPDAAHELKARATKLGMNLMLVKLKHLGSDRLPGYIGRLEQHLRDGGVTFLPQTVVREVQLPDKQGTSVQTERGDTLRAQYLLLAPGRSGNQWLSDQLARLGAKLEYRAIEVGVRLEVPQEILHDITQIVYDPALFFFSRSYDDQLRTFCTNPRGFVSREDYKKFVCVNGHAYKDRHSANTNLALLYKISLSEPITNTIAYGESIAELANTIGGGKPLLQRFADFRRFRRSTWGRLRKTYVEPTLSDVTPGDIGMALPHRVLVNLLEGIERLDELIPGMASDSTLLYAPEVKFHSCRPAVDSYMETQIESVFVAGDGAGVSGNIVGAAATGVIAARRIAAKASLR